MTSSIYLVHFKEFGYQLAHRGLLCPVIAGVDDAYPGFDNIAGRDAYSEMRIAYWVWQNDPIQEWTGMFHYRRALDFRPPGNPPPPNPENFLQYLNWLDENPDEVESRMHLFDVIVPIHDNSDLTAQYCGCHRTRDWEIFVEILKKEGFGDGKLSHGHFCNIFVMNRRWFDRYMTDWWSVMQQVEARIELPPKEDYQRRVFGYLSERFLTIWLDRMQREEPALRVLELPLLFSPIS